MTEEHIVKILHTKYETHDVKRFTVEKPPHYSFKSGQATEVAIHKPGWENKKHPFTFTSLNDWENLEFTIKIYRNHQGVTNELDKLHPNDELILHDVWGAIEYNGKGIFIAGGAGITPFISIFRQLEKDKQLKGNRLIFSNKTAEDIILKDEFERMLNDDFLNILTREPNGRRIDKEYLKEKITDFTQHFYICGPEKFVKDINEMLENLGANPEALTFEK